MRDQRHAVCFDAATGEEIPDLSGALREREKLRQFKEEADDIFTAQTNELNLAREQAKLAQQVADAERSRREKAEQRAKRQREGREAAAKEIAQATEKAHHALAALRETLLGFLSEVDTPSPDLTASINACADVTKLQAAIRRAPKLTSLEGFSLENRG